jgi:hypothetical protein
MVWYKIIKNNTLIPEKYTIFGKNVAQVQLIWPDLHLTCRSKKGNIQGLGADNSGGAI